jgi:hypothetical protein
VYNDYVNGIISIIFIKVAAIRTSQGPENNMECNAGRRLESCGLGLKTRVTVP